MASQDKITEVLMPLMGEGVNEATLVRWLKKAGDKIEKSEPLLEVSTDKVDTEIPAPVSGFLLQTNAEAGSQVEVNSVLAFIGTSADLKITSSNVSKKSPKNQTAAVTGTADDRRSPELTAIDDRATHAVFQQPDGRMRASPLVRKIAREVAIDLPAVAGSGLGGRITKDDLQYHVEKLAKLGHGQRSAASNRLKTQLRDGQEFLEGVLVRREKMSKMRQLIAAHMTESVQLAPHATTVFEIDLHKVATSLEQYKSAFLEREGFKLTYTAYFIHAAAQAIKQHPVVNCSVDGDDILHKDQINIGCAVALPTGLIVPVIKNAGELNLTGIARALNDLVTRARSKKLLPEDVQGGTFSVTNPGGWGSVVSNPIINQPQVAILGIGAIVKRPVVIANDITIRPMVMIGLTFDHRVVDGEGGAKYLATLKEILENYSQVPN